MWHRLFFEFAIEVKTPVQGEDYYSCYKNASSVSAALPCILTHGCSSACNAARLQPHWKRWWLQIWKLSLIDGGITNHMILQRRWLVRWNRSQNSLENQKPLVSHNSLGTSRTPRTGRQDPKKKDHKNTSPTLSNRRQTRDIQQVLTRSADRVFCRNEVRIEIRQKATTQKRAKKRLRDVTHQLQNMHQNREKNYVVNGSSVFERSQIIIVHNVFSFFSSSASSARREPHIASSDSCVFLLHLSSVTRLFNSFPIIFSSTSVES